MIDVQQFISTYTGPKNKNWKRMLRDRKTLKETKNFTLLADDILGKVILGHVYGEHYARAFKFWIDKTYGYGIEDFTPPTIPAAAVAVFLHREAA